MGAAAGLGAAAMAVSAAGSLISGIQGYQAYNYNAAVARQEAKYARQRAGIEEGQFRRQLAADISRQRVLQGASGTTGGSNITALERTIREGEYDAQIIRYGGSVDSWRATSQSKIFSSMAPKALFAGGLGAGTTLLTGTSKWDWKKYGQTKKFGDLFK